jgi:hypothetical protein
MWVKNPFTVNMENEEILQLNESEMDSLIEILINSPWLIFGWVVEMNIHSYLRKQSDS